MLDPFLVPKQSPKIRRECCNPLCRKLLSNLNKQDLCFCCFNEARFQQSALAGYRPAPARFRR